MLGLWDMESGGGTGTMGWDRVPIGVPQSLGCSKGPCRCDRSLRVSQCSHSQVRVPRGQPRPHTRTGSLELEPPHGQAGWDGAMGTGDSSTGAAGRGAGRSEARDAHAGAVWALSIVAPSRSKAPVHLLGLSSTHQHGPLGPRAARCSHASKFWGRASSQPQGKQLGSGLGGQNWLTQLVTLQLLFSAGIQLRRLSASISGLLKGSCTQQPACFSPNYFSRAKKRYHLPLQTLPPLFVAEKIEGEKERRKVSAAVPSRLNVSWRKTGGGSDGRGTEHPRGLVVPNPAWTGLVEEPGITLSSEWEILGLPGSNCSIPPEA